MRIYEKDEDGNVLFHSDTYLGEDYISANLQHWKYLKKEKLPNGKFKYYYYNEELNNLKKDIDQANTDMHRAVIDHVNYNAKKGMENKKVSKLGKDGKIKDISYQYKNVTQKSEKAWREAKAFETQRNRLMSKYTRKTIASIPAKIIASGAAFVLNLFQKRKK